MGLARSLVNWVKAVGYLLTGRIDSAREVLDVNPHVVQAKYDEIIKDRVSRIQQYKNAVAGLITQQEKKIALVKKLTDEVEKLENLKAGAAAKARQTVEALKAQGLGEEAVRGDADYQKCLAAFNDFSATLAEKQERIVELEGDIDGYGKSIADHKVQLQQILRELDDLKSEQAEAVADVITAREEKEISDMISGIAEDGMAEELQRMRDLRQKVKANARVSKELAGTDTKAQEAEFLEYARKGVESAAFDELIGLGGVSESVPDLPEADEGASSSAEQTRLPE